MAGVKVLIFKSQTSTDQPPNQQLEEKSYLEDRVQLGWVGRSCLMVTPPSYIDTCLANVPQVLSPPIPRILFPHQSFL